MTPDIKMKPDIKKKWLTALRSGEYKQGHKVLHNNGEFCCLGVLCDIYQKDHDNGTSWVQGAEGMEIDSPSGSQLYYLTGEVMEWAGLESISPRVMHLGRSYQLADLNDVYNWTFEQIADSIETRL